MRPAHDRRRALGMLLAALLPAATPLAAPQRIALFVRLAGPIGPEARAARFEDPLDEALRAAGLGEVTGGGTMYGPDGRVLWAGLKVALAYASALTFVRTQLVALGAPAGSTIELEGRAQPVAVHGN